MDVKVRLDNKVHTWKFPNSMIQSVVSNLGEDSESCRRIVKNIVVRLASILESQQLQGTVTDVEVICLMHIRTQEGLPEPIKKAVTEVLDAWKAAEESISPEARRGLRVAERMIPILLSCQNREEFDKYFTQVIYPNVEEKHVKAIVRFFNVLGEWATKEEPPVKEDSHYIEKYILRIFNNHVVPFMAVKKKEVIAKRFRTAADTMSEYV